MYKIPEERVGQKPDKHSAEYRFGHLQYYDYLVVEKFALYFRMGSSTKAFQAKAFKLYSKHQLQLNLRAEYDVKRLTSLGGIYRNGTIIFRYVNTDENFRLCELVSLKTLGRLLTCPKSSGCWGGEFTVIWSH